MEDYQVKKKLYSSVTRDRDVLLVEKQGKVYAMKRLDLDDDLKKQEVVFNEVKLLQNLAHPNIIKYLEAFEHQKRLCIVMEYAQNGDLKERVMEMKETGGLFSEELIWEWFAQLCLAVKYLHDKHILHRDLKILNVFISEDGLCKLGDFGVSKQLENSEVLTSTHVGTAYYLPPEICNNNSYDHKVDIWMLGCLLYELCALSKPFEGDNLFAVIKQIIQKEQPPLPEQFSNTMKLLVSAMMQKEPEMRPDINQIISISEIQLQFKKLKESHAEIYQDFTFPNPKKYTGFLKQNKPTLSNKAFIPNDDGDDNCRGDTITGSNSSNSNNNPSAVPPQDNQTAQQQQMPSNQQQQQSSQQSTSPQQPTTSARLQPSSLSQAQQPNKLQPSSNSKKATLEQQYSITNLIKQETLNKQLSPIYSASSGMKQQSPIQKVAIAKQKDHQQQQQQFIQLQQQLQFSPVSSIQNTSVKNAISAQLSARQEETFGIVSGNSNNNSKPLDEIIISLQPQQQQQYSVQQQQQQQWGQQQQGIQFQQFQGLQQQQLLQQQQQQYQQARFQQIKKNSHHILSHIPTQQPQQSQSSTGIQGITAFQGNQSQLMNNSNNNFYGYSNNVQSSQQLSSPLYFGMGYASQSENVSPMHLNSISWNSQQQSQHTQNSAVQQQQQQQQSSYQSIKSPQQSMVSELESPIVSLPTLVTYQSAQHQTINLQSPPPSLLPIPAHSSQLIRKPQIRYKPPIVIDTTIAGNFSQKKSTPNSDISHGAPSSGRSTNTNNHSQVLGGNSKGSGKTNSSSNRAGMMIVAEGDSNSTKNNSGSSNATSNTSSTKNNSTKSNNNQQSQQNQPAAKTRPKYFNFPQSPNRTILVSDYLKQKLGEDKFFKVKALLESSPNPLKFLEEHTQAVADVIGEENIELAKIFRYIIHSHSVTPSAATNHLRHKSFQGFDHPFSDGSKHQIQQQQQLQQQQLAQMQQVHLHSLSIPQIQHLQMSQQQTFGSPQQQQQQFSSFQAAKGGFFQEELQIAQQYQQQHTPIHNSNSLLGTPNSQLKKPPAAFSATPMYIHPNPSFSLSPNQQFQMRQQQEPRQQPQTNLEQLSDNNNITSPQAFSLVQSQQLFSFDQSNKNINLNNSLNQSVQSGYQFNSSANVMSPLLKDSQQQSQEHPFGEQKNATSITTAPSPDLIQSFSQIQSSLAIETKDKAACSQFLLSPQEEEEGESEENSDNQGEEEIENRGKSSSQNIQEDQEDEDESDFTDQ